MSGLKFGKSAAPGEEKGNRTRIKAGVIGASTSQYHRGA